MFKKIVRAKDGSEHTERVISHVSTCPVLAVPPALNGGRLERVN
jgi:hypothetical protein